MHFAARINSSLILFVYHNITLQRLQKYTGNDRKTRPLTVRTAAVHLPLGVQAPPSGGSPLEIPGVLPLL